MSTSDPSPTLTDGNVGTSTPTTTSSQSSSDTATLYLFTFLATILILVLLSASLVLRSYILRRRYRQHFQQALTGGLFVDNAFHGAGQFDSLAGFRRSTRRSGPKPVLWDTWIHPADNDPAWSWSSITPVAVRCASLSPSTFSQPSTGSPSSPQSQPRPSFLTHLRFPSPFSISPRSSSLLAGQAETSNESSHSGSRSPPRTTPRPPESDKDAATLSVCVLVVMPDVSTPVYHPLPNTKGKGVDPQPLGSQATQRSGDADPLLPSVRRTRARIPNFSTDKGLPVLEFGVVEMKAGEWAWRT